MTALEYIGAGRSAKVFRGTLADGRAYAQKVFTGEGTSRAILQVLTGAENPYRWCEAAMATAVARRKVLGHLLSFWFGDKVRLPEMYDWGWNDDFKAYQFRVELINGGHAPLKNPLSREPWDYYAELTKQVMHPLQKRLRDSGFDGMLWQAGLGNPVAANNFMLEKQADGSHRWVWIDMESGLPALFALNVWRTLSFYLPKSYHHGRPLFDDVDIPSLQQYVSTNNILLLQHLGEDGWMALEEAVRELADAQQRWTSVGRLERGLQAAEKTGALSAEQAEQLRAQPWRWPLTRASLAARAICSMFKRKRTEQDQPDKREETPWTKHLGRWQRYLCSSAYRSKLAQLRIQSRISDWHKRGGLSTAQAMQLHQRLRDDYTSAMLSKFTRIDFCAAIGRNFPIWGGEDTATEHWFLRHAIRLFGN